MDAKRIIGVLLIVVGVIALVWGGISYTRERTVVDLGPIEARTQERETIPLPPVLGGVALVAGVLLLFVPARTRG
jgi:uncharacterized membrane protein HdeD (DUF308 family)